MIILRWVFRKLDLGLWTEWSWLRIETDGNENRGSIKCREFLD